MNKNYSDELRSASMGTICMEIMHEALASIDPENLVLDSLKRYGNLLSIQGKVVDLRDYQRIHAMGAGKAAPFLFYGLRQVIGDRLVGGIIVSLPENRFADDVVRFYSGSHPIPDEASLMAGEAIIDYIEHNVMDHDLVFFLLTGGASSLIEAPRQPLTISDIGVMNDLLLSSGANIVEMNMVRKHMSRLKGGGLARLISPATTVTLIISDIVGSPLNAIGSAPTACDPTTFEDALRILERYSILDRLDESFRRFFKDGIKGIYMETPKPDESVHQKNLHFILGDNSLLLQNLSEIARREGIHVGIVDTGDQGDAQEMAKKYAMLARSFIDKGEQDLGPILLLAGGEVTVKVTGNGKGGRNQHFMLSLLKEVKDIRSPFYFMSMGTDGIDGPTEAAGAWIDNQTISKVNSLGLDMDHYLKNCDSYQFFKQLDQLIITGPTHTNMMDLRMFFIGN